jgi:hypothetical protein
MRGLEHRNVPEIGSGGALGSLVGGLLEELANEVPDDPRLESVRMDLIAASRLSGGQQKDLTLRFYLAFRSLLRENELLVERLRKAEKRNYALEVGHIAAAPPSNGDREEENLDGHAPEAVIDSHLHKAASAHA